MALFNSLPESWARIAAAVNTIGIGVVAGFLIDARFGLGIAVGGLAGMAIHWGARIDERPFWKHIFGEAAVYSEREQTPEDRQEEEIRRLKLKVAELLAASDQQAARGPAETGVQGASAEPRDE